jgi:glycosyltransferase involved in cell wall biosynthesis
MKGIYLISNPDLDPSANTGYGRHIRENLEGFQNAGIDLLALHVKYGVIDYRIKSVTNSRSSSPGLVEFAKVLLPSLIFQTIKDLVHVYRQWRFKRAWIGPIKEFNPDFIYERTSYLGFVGRELSDDLEVPLILEVNAPAEEERTKFSGRSLAIAWSLKITKANYHAAAQILCVSQALKKFIEEVFSVPTDKIVSNPNGVNTHIQDFEGIIEQEPNIQTIGFVGSIMPYHGVETLLRSFAISHSTNPNIELLIVGDGSILNELQELSASLRVDHVVKFTGSVAHQLIGAHISAMDICIMPASNWYGSPVKIFEYGLFSKPIIAPNTGPVAEVMRNNQDGILIDGETSLTSAINWMFEHPDQALEMGRSFNTRILQSYTWNHNIARILVRLKLAMNGQ